MTSTARIPLAERLGALITDRSINQNANDVGWFSGWDRKAHTSQYRFNAKEATALAAAIKEFTPRIAKALVRELDRRSTKETGHYVGQISFISQASAKVMNKLAKDLGLDNTFDVEPRRFRPPMG